jgi:hypothetical protein
MAAILCEPALPAIEAFQSIAESVTLLATRDFASWQSPTLRLSCRSEPFVQKHLT